jgi:hypothetical protein
MAHVPSLPLPYPKPYTLNPKPPCPMFPHSHSPKPYTLNPKPMAHVPSLPLPPSLSLSSPAPSLSRSFQSSYQGDSNFLEQLTGEKKIRKKNNSKRRQLLARAAHR